MDNEIKAEMRSHPTISLGSGERLERGLKSFSFRDQNSGLLQICIESGLFFLFVWAGLFCCHCLKNSCFVPHSSSFQSSVIQRHLALVSFEVHTSVHFLCFEVSSGTVNPCAFLV